jgi:elongation factor P hydroxylase
MTTIDFGYWRLPDGRRALLCWHPRTGDVVLHHPSGRSDLITTIHDEAEVRERLVDWPSHCDLRTGLGWLASQLDGAR